MPKRDASITFRVDSETHAALQLLPAKNANLSAREIVERALDEAAAPSPQRDLLSELDALQGIARDLERRIAALRRRLSEPSENGGAK